MEATSSFGHWIRRQRKALDLTQQALAERVGCSLAAIKKIEQDERRPSRQIAELLADVLGVPSGQREIFLEVARGLRPANRLVPVQKAATSALPTGIVTFLFTDIEDSTKLAREHPETWETLRARHHRILRETMEAHHGYVFQIIGDAFCVAFDTPKYANHAAVEAQRKLQSENWGETPLHVRMGLHTGEAEAHGDEYHGYLTLSLVERLMSAGHGSQILLSHATENLLRGHLPKDVSLLDLGEHRFKDIQQLVRVFQVLAPDLQKEFPALRVLDVLPNNLPVQLTSFIGRAKEIVDVIRLLEKARLVTLTGPGGTGKTRLAIQVGNQLLNQYPEGLWLVELAPLNDPSLIRRTIASVFELREAPNVSIMDMIINYLRAKQSLLILDNCEHLVEACARMADTLLHACPNIRILATSREALGIAGETLYLVPSLTRPDVRNLPSLGALDQYEAIKLFIDRASSAIPTFTLTNENASSIVQICQHLDGIPLAIELAASKVRALSVQQIAQRLGDRFRLLTGGNRTALPRHQTLQAAIEWSYNLLSPAEQVLIRRLSVLVGGWTLEAAESICSDTSVNKDDVLGLLEHLINKSIIILEDDRYHMLETIRQYANEKLFESREAEQIRDRHLEFYLRFAGDAEPKLRSGEQVVWLERIETENDNLRAALAWSLESGKGGHTLQLAGALSYFWELGSSREGYKWLDAALMLTEGRRNETVEQALSRAKALYGAGRLHFVASFEPSDGRIKVEKSLLIARQMGDRWLVAVTLEHLGWMATLEGDIETAYAHLEEGISLSRDLKDPWPLALCLLRLASPLMRTDSSRATQTAKEGLILARNLGDSELLSYGLIQLGGAFFMMTNFVEAALAAEEALERARAIGSGYITMSLFFLAVISSLQGHSEKAESFCSQLCDHARETKYAFQIGIALIALALVTNHRGQSALSARLLAASEAQFHRLGIELNMYGGPIFIAYKKALEKAQAQLDLAAFQAAWAEGQRMTIEQALALAPESALSG